MEDNFIALKDPRLFVLVWMSMSSIRISERGELIDTMRRKNDDIFDTLWLDYKQQVRAFNDLQEKKPNSERRHIRAVAETDMKKAITELISKEKTTHKNDLIKSLMCEKEDLSHINHFTNVLMRENNPKISAILAHWIWLVKNKMKGVDVSYHIMPIFFGKQGGGKTVATNKLLEPIKNYSLNIKMSQLVDERYFFALSENFVVFFDEMAGASRTDVDSLKNQITTNFNDVRKLGTNTITKVAQSCSFVGATNRPINEQILDTTGMRRFYEIKVSDLLDWSLLDKIDFLALWKGVDENKVNGYILPFINEISIEQQKHVLEEELDLFIKEFKIDFNTKETKDFIANDIYQVYYTWSKTSGFNPLNKVWFGKKFINKGAIKGLKNISGKSYNIYTINKDCSIHESVLTPFLLPIGEMNKWTT